MWSEGILEVSPDRFGSFEAIEVLYDFDGPKIFTAVDKYGGLLLCYQCGESSKEATLDYLVVPSSAKCIEHLKKGVLTVHQALDQPWLWALKCKYDGMVSGAWKLDGLHEVPQTARPSPDATLWAHLMPLLSYRLLGDGLANGTVPASVVAAAVVKPTAAIKRLLQAAIPRPVQGRPENALRSLYDLIAQRMAFNSFEVSFQPSNPEQLRLSDGDDPYATGAASLRQAMEWLSDKNPDADLDLNLLEVLEVLAPPTHGLITATEVKGRLISNRSLRLSRDDTRRVRGAIAAKKVALELVAMTGRIRELDRDKRTFILRQNGAPETVCSYDEEHFDIVFEAFENEVAASIQGRIVGTSRLVEVIAIERVPTVQINTAPTEESQLVASALAINELVGIRSYRGLVREVEPSLRIGVDARRAYPRETQVNLADKESIAYWTAEFKCSIEQLRVAVSSAGSTEPEAVRRALGAAS